MPGRAVIKGEHKLPFRPKIAEVRITLIGQEMKELQQLMV